MILSNLSDRGTLRGSLMYSVEDYNILANKPQINSNELVGNKTGHQLGLANLDDIIYVEANPAGTPSEDLTKLQVGDVIYNIAGQIVYGDASGTIASFDDGGDNKPLKSLVIGIEAVQSGSGDPSPSNVRPISGWSAVNICRTGINIWDEEWEVGGINRLGNNTPASDRIRSKNYISCKPNTSYYLKYLLATNEIRLSYYDVNKTFISQSNWLYNGAFTAPTNAYYFRLHTSGVYGSTYNYDISINYPSTDTDYHSYNGQTYTIQLGDTYYGGELDVTTGMLTVDRVKITLRDSTTLSLLQSGAIWLLPDDVIVPTQSLAEYVLSSHYKSITQAIQDDNSICKTQGNKVIRINDSVNATSLQDYKDYVEAQYNNGTPVEIVYFINTPITIQLTPTQITTLLGQNNLWADSGQVLEGEYFISL